MENRIECDRMIEAARQLAPQVQACADEIERLRRLPDGLVEDLRAAGFFRMAMPRGWGGPEADPITQLRIIEELAAADASTAWCVFVGSDGGYYTAHMDDAVGRKLYPTLDEVTAGFINATGRGVKVPGGLRVTGRWPFASASHHARYLVSGVQVVDEGAEVVDFRNEPRFVYLPIASCKLLDNWDTIGLAGSGSQDYVAEDVFVPDEHTFNHFAPTHRREGPLYQYVGLHVVKMAGIPLGVARGSIDRLITFAQNKKQFMSTEPLSESPLMQTAVARSEMLVGAARSFILETVGDVWAALCANRAPSPRERARLRLAILNAFSSGKEAVQIVYDAAGGSAVYRKNGFERPLRDMLTATQHSVIRPKQIEQVGRLLLGLEPYTSFL